mgnify:CR=1 FL=1
MRVADDRNLEDEQFLRDLIKNFVHRVLVFDNEIRISFYFGEEKTFPLVKREAGAIVRENLTMLHHNRTVILMELPFCFFVKKT